MEGEPAVLLKNEQFSTISSKVIYRLGLLLNQAKYPAHETASISTHSGQISLAYLRSQVRMRSISV